MLSFTEGFSNDGSRRTREQTAGYRPGSEKLKAIPAFVLLRWESLGNRGESAWKLRFNYAESEVTGVRFTHSH